MKSSKKNCKRGPTRKLAISGHQKTKCFFFSITRKLDSVGLDPKYDLDNEHVIGKECRFLFGGSKNSKSIPLF